MQDHQLERDAERRLHAVHHHAEGVAHQYEIHMIVEKPRGMRVITGETNDGRSAFASADLRHRDAAGFLLCGHASPPLSVYHGP